MSLENIINSKILLFLVVIATGLLYFPLNQRNSLHYWESKIDTKIPLVPVFIVPYIFLFFPYLIFGPMALWQSEVMKSFLRSFIIANIVAYIIWHFFPNGVKRPVIKIDGFWKKLVKKLYAADIHDTNGFPSSHVYYSSIISWYLTLAYPSYSFLFLFSGGLIILSTLFTKQHYVIDVIGGLVLSIISISIVGFAS